MIRKLVTTGNSLALTFNKMMRDHLGVDREVEVQFTESTIVIKKPDSDAKKFAREFSREHDRAMKRLAE